MKESVLAAEVFGRDDTFDSRTDSVVRVEARNLRARLNEYYRGEGSRDPVIIDLPKGTYVPVFRPGSAAAALPLWRRKLRLRGIAALLTILLLGGAAWWFVKHRPDYRRAQSPSMAVLPFLNLASGPDEAYFSDGFVEDLTTDLGSLPGLRVAARTSAFQFRGRNEDVREIGRKLGVGMLLEGSVRRQAARVKITAQLIDTRSGYHVWARTLERDIADIEEAEREVVRAVAKTLAVGSAEIASPHIPKPEAREAYWRGRYLRGNWQEPEESLRYFERAVALDPEFAEAWAALASSRSALAFQMVGSAAEQAGQARTAARKAIALDPAVPEAYLTLGALAYSYDYDWPAAERSYRRALELNGNSAGAHRAYALALTAHGRFREAVEHLQTAQELDPLSIVSTNNLAVTLYLSRRYDEAIQVAKRHLDMDAKFFPARIMIGVCHIAQGKLAEGVVELERGTTEGGRPVEFVGDLGYALARSGRLVDAAAAQAELEAIEKAKGTAGVALARIHAGRGESKEAIECLRHAADAHVADVTFIGVDPMFDTLRGQKDFAALCARLGLPNGSRGR